MLPSEPVFTPTSCISILCQSVPTLIPRYIDLSIAAAASASLNSAANMARSTSVRNSSRSPSEPAKPPEADAEEEEDDYLTMTFAEPSSTSTKKESLTQATKRKQREAEVRGRPKSKAEVAAEEVAKRDEALSRSTLDPTSKGFKMMAKLGYKPGSALGKADANGGTGLLEPVGVEMKEGRSGIGADAEKKRKFREEVEVRAEGEKKVKVDEGDFRERQRMERGERKREGQIAGAQKVAERLEEENESRKASDGAPGDDGLQGENGKRKGKKQKSKPLSQINVLWRGAVNRRELAERDRRIRYDLHQSLSRLPTYDDPEEDNDDKMAFGRKDAEEVELDLDQEDPELDDFEALASSDRLQKLVHYLRERWHYCFWCKYRYEDSKMEGCPGITEDDHD
jgi:Domain of unknown function (DUF4187)/G-patch domain